MSFAGELVRKAREELELSQTEVAKEIGFTNVFLNRVELGRVDLPVGQVEKFAKVLKIDKEDIMKALKKDFSARLELRAK